MWWSAHVVSVLSFYSVDPSLSPLKSTVLICEFLEKKEKRLEIAHLNKHKALKLTMIQTRVVNL